MEICFWEYAHSPCCSSHSLNFTRSCPVGRSLPYSVRMRSMSRSLRARFSSISFFILLRSAKSRAISRASSMLIKVGLLPRSRIMALRTFTVCEIARRTTGLVTSAKSSSVGWRRRVRVSPSCPLKSYPAAAQASSYFIPFSRKGISLSQAFTERWPNLLKLIVSAMSISISDRPATARRGRILAEVLYVERTRPSSFFCWRVSPSKWFLESLLKAARIW